MIISFIQTCLKEITAVFSSCLPARTQSGSPENECQKEAWGITNGQEVPICFEMKSQNPNHLDVEPTPIREQDAWAQSEQGTYITKKIRQLRQSFSSRAQRIKERIVVQPPTPSPSPTPSEPRERQARPRLQSLIQPYEDQQADDLWLDEMVAICCCHAKRRYIPTFPKVLDPQSKLYISWLLIVTLCYLYNAWAIFLRSAFPYQTDDNLYIFFSFDYFSDITYFVDIFIFKVRIQYLHDGFWVDDPVMTRKNYLMKSMFKMDLLSLLPLDLLYLKYGTNSLFRMPRILKVQTFWEFFNRVDAVAKSPYVIRILRTFIYMMYLIHLNACAYYAMSSWEGIGSNGWVFNGTGNAYIRCVYFATKTATSIGKNPKPENEYEYAFMTVSWLMGVFIFAFLIGQIRDIVATATQSKTQYRQRMDQTVQYMRNLGLPDDLQRKVRLWLNHTWEQQKTLDEAMILDSLPRKMKTDVAINVHYNTLVKVQLFKDCDKALLRDLVLKLKPVLFLPSDYVCMRGEVGKEMYIVNKGLVQVMGGEDGNLVLATLSEGSVFGEISLLGIQGCNRRTADVRSKGFSNLFVLSKSDLWDALKNYPEAQTLLKKKAKSLIRQNEALRKQKSSSQITAEPIIKDLPSKTDTPKFIKTVIQVIPDDSTTGKILKTKSSIPTIQKSKSATNMTDDTSPQSEIKISKKTKKSVQKQKSVSPSKKNKEKAKSSSTPSDKICKKQAKGVNIPINKQANNTPIQADTGPINKEEDSTIESDMPGAKKQSDTVSDQTETEEVSVQSITLPTKHKNTSKEMNKQLNKIDEVTVHSQKDPCTQNNQITFTQLNEESPNKESTEKSLAIILNQKTEDNANKIPTKETNTQPFSTEPSKHQTISKDMTTVKPDTISGVLQIASPEHSGNVTQSTTVANQVTSPNTTTILSTTPASTESSPSTETEESKIVAQDANEFLNSILQLIPPNRQSLKLNKRATSNASNSKVQPSQKTSDKEDSNSITSVLSLNSLFRTSSDDGISDSESVATPTELSLQPSTSTSSLIGYDNLAFNTQDANGKRKSSLFSDETSC